MIHKLSSTLLIQYLIFKVDSDIPRTYIINTFGLLSYALNRELTQMIYLTKTVVWSFYEFLNCIYFILNHSNQLEPWQTIARWPSCL